MRNNIEENNMSKPKTIYVVTHGDYSAYDIDGLFSTPKKAQEWIDSTYNPSDYNIEEYVLDSNQPDRSDKLYDIRIDYETFDARIVGARYTDSRRAKGITDSIRMANSGVMEMHFVTNDPKRALKIASERLAQVKAEEWRYPLLHTLCKFGSKGVNEAIKKGFLSHCFAPYTWHKYPAYRFGTGEPILDEDEELVDFEII